MCYLLHLQAHIHFLITNTLIHSATNCLCWWSQLILMLQTDLLCIIICALQIYNSSPIKSRVLQCASGSLVHYRFFVLKMEKSTFPVEVSTSLQYINRNINVNIILPTATLSRFQHRRFFNWPSENAKSAIGFIAVPRLIKESGAIPQVRARKFIDILCKLSAAYCYSLHTWPSCPMNI